MSVLRRMVATIIILLAVTTTVQAATHTTQQIDEARAKGFAWLIRNQNSDGSWSISSGSKVQPTATAIEALLNAGIKSGLNFTGGVSWLGNAEAPNADSLSRQIRALSLAGMPYNNPALSALYANLNNQKNSIINNYLINQYSWGAYKAYYGSFPDTSLALDAIASMYGGSTDLLAKTAAFITGKKNVDNGWPYMPNGIDGTKSWVIPTAYSVMALSNYKKLNLPNQAAVDAEITGGVNWLLAKVKADGGFADDDTVTSSSIYETALVFLALRQAGNAGNVAAIGAATDMTNAQDLLLDRQEADWSWGRESLQTAMVLLALPTVTLTDSDVDGVPDVVELQLGRNPAVADSFMNRLDNRQHIVVSPLSAEFGVVAVGSTATITFNLADIIRSGVFVGSLGTTSPDYRITRDTCAQTTIASGGCSFDVTFSPLTQGLSIASVSILSNDPLVPEFKIPLTGRTTAQAISFNPLPAKSYGDEPFALYASATNSLAISFTSSNPAVATISGNLVTITGAGTTTITAAQSGSNSAPSVLQTLTVDKRYQIIGFYPPPAKLVYDASFDLSQFVSDGGSGIPVTFAIISGPGSLSGSTLAMSGEGDIVISASQAGNNNYYAASPVERAITVNLQNKVIAIDAGCDYTAALRSDGSVVAWGKNYYGLTTVPVAALSDVIAIAAGCAHLVALKRDGSVVAWGSNNSGQVAVPVTAKSGVIAIASGYSHTVALKSDGSVVAWGFNDYGESTVPNTISQEVIAIAAGANRSVALKSDGSVYAWGLVSSVPSSATYSVKAIATGHAHTLALKSDGSVIAWGMDILGSSTVPISANTNIVAIAAGHNHSLALKNDGSVVAWGANRNGQATVPSSAMSGVVAIAGGFNHSVALKSDGRLVAWGSNDYGESNVYSFSVNPSVPSGRSVMFTANIGGLNCFWNGSAVDGDCIANNIAPNTKVVLTANLSENMQIVWGQGCDSSTATTCTISSLATNTIISPSIIVKGVPNITFFPLPAKVYGDPIFNLSATASTGLPVTFLSSNPGVAVINGNVLKIVGAGTTTIYATQDGDANHAAATPAEQLLTVSKAKQTISFYPIVDKVFGDAPFDLNPYVVGGASSSPITFSLLSGSGFLTGSTLTITGADKNIVVTANQAEDSNYLAASVRRTISTSVPKITAIAAGYGHTMALKSDGSVLAWGYNNTNQATVPESASSGVLAIAAQNTRKVFLKDDGSVEDWDGRVLPTPAIAKTGVKAIECGSWHTVALKNDGSVAAWGWDTSSAQTNVPVSAISDIFSIAASEYNSVAVKNDGSVVIWGGQGAGSVVPASVSGVIAATLGNSHGIALKSEGSVVAWGNNYYGQTNVPVTAMSGVMAVSAGLNHTLALKNDGSVVAWGDNRDGQATVPSSAMSGVVAIAAGSYHSVALKSDGSVIAWGDDDWGPLNMPQHTLTLNPTGSISSQASQPVRITTHAGGLDCLWDGTTLSGTCVSGSLISTTAVVLTASLPADTTISWGTGCDAITANSCTIYSLKADTTISPVTWGKSSQSIIFNPPQVKTFGNPPIDLSQYATGGASGNPVTFSVNSGPGFLNGNILTITGAGNIVVTASQAGDANYFTASTTQVITVLNGPTLTVSLSGTGTGKVVSSPAGINCGGQDLVSYSYSCGSIFHRHTCYGSYLVPGSCSKMFPVGSAVILNATPYSGSSFIGWGGGLCAGILPCNFTLTENMATTSTFALLPVASFHASLSSSGAPAQVIFTNNSLYSNSWLWDFSDGTTSDQQNPVHIFRNPGVYIVSLTATNAAGSDTKNVSINLGPCESPVRIGSSNYATIQSAYDASADGDIVRILALDFTENMSVGQGKSVTLDGGYLCGSEANPAGTTVLYGTPQISNGTVKLKNIQISQ